MPKITHLNKKGEANMVNVGDKKISKRYAMAEGIVRVNEEIIEKIKKDNLPKGDLFGTARIAGILAAKKTSELIPLCHNLIISSIEIEIKLIKNDIHVLSKVKCDGKTGVEMVHEYGNLSDYEKAGFDEMMPDLKAQIEKGIQFVAEK